MNNRLVLQLREKAYKKASARAISLPYEMKNSEFDTMFQEMFVELIVRECAMKANATAIDLRIRTELDARKHVGDCILKCFGVEE